MQYQIEINGRTRRVTVHRSAGMPGMFIVDVDGASRTVSAERIDAHTLSLLVREDSVASGFSRTVESPVASGISRTSDRTPGRTSSHEVTVAPTGASGQAGVSIGVRTVAVSLGDRRRRGSRDPGAQATSGSERIVAPMPGKVVRVLVTPGVHVQPRQAVVVVEAMKMENELRATRSGVVKDVLVQDGQSVEAGSLLLVIAGHSEQHAK